MLVIYAYRVMQTTNENGKKKYRGMPIFKGPYVAEREDFINFFKHASGVFDMLTMTENATTQELEIWHYDRLRKHWELNAEYYAELYKYVFSPYSTHQVSKYMYEFQPPRLCTIWEFYAEVYERITTHAPKKKTLFKDPHDPNTKTVQ